MRWLVVFVLLAGCVRARATVVHPTDYERVSGGKGSTIARVDPSIAVPVSETQEPKAEPTNRESFELGALVPFRLETAHVHLSPGVRIFGGAHGSTLFGVSVGADFIRAGRTAGFALEGSVHAGDSSSDLLVIEQAVDLFAGVTVHSRRSTAAVAIGPSLGMLGLPGGHSVVTIGLGLRLTGGHRSDLDRP